jgi:nucleoid DNA-binding protein/cell division septation protein DedD
MNLADYLSELLGQHDEVNVPGLGYFIRNRINAHYNDREGRFYPPYHQVKFVPQPKDDDTFAQYLADKKNISLASSKYFIEKFITKIKEDASRGKFLFADLGSFQTDSDQLVFKPNERVPADPAFYGYPPIDIFKASQPLSADMRKPALGPAQPASLWAASATLNPPPPGDILAPEYYEEEVEEKRGLNVWLILLIVLAIFGVALIGIYKLYPQAFDKVKDEYNNLKGKTVDTPAVIRRETKEVNKDTVQKTAPLTDSASKAIAAVAKPDSVKTLRFEAITDEFINLQAANARVARLKGLGFNAYIVLDAPGPRLKVSVGAYPTYNAADSAINVLFKAGHIKKRHIPIEIKPQ